MLKITDIKKGTKVKVNGNPAIKDNVYVIDDVVLTERGLWLDLSLESDPHIHRDEKVTDCELA